MSKLIVNEIEKYDAGQLTITTGTNVSIGSDLTVGGALAGTLSTAAQPNVTSVGTLSSLAVSGNLTVDTNTLFVDSANNRVGIGTASPDKPLVLRAAAPEFKIQTNTPTNGLAHALFGVGNQGSLFISADPSADGNNTAIMYFGVNGAEAMRINSSGNVGIGTSSPQASGGYGVLQLNGSTGGVVKFSDDDTLVSQIYGNDTAVNVQAEGARSVVIRTNSAERMRIDSSGNVGIGTTPAAWGTPGGTKALQVSTRGAISEAFDGVALSNNYYFNGSAGGETYIESDEAARILLGGNGDISFANAPAGTAGTQIIFNERMRIDSSGNILINKTSFSNAGGGVILRTDSTFGGQIRLTRVDNTGTQQHAIFYTFSGSGIGSITTSTTSTAYNTTSDYRLKENVVPMEGALDRVDALKPSRFNFIADPSTTVDGFLAHQVAEVIPEAITGEKDAVDEEGNPIYQGIDQSKIVPLLVGAIKELRAEIELLKAQINN
jgi:hypothetical protein